MDFPYVLQDVMDIIEVFCASWEEEFVWDYLHVPKAQRGIHNEDAWDRSLDIWRE